MDKVKAFLSWGWSILWTTGVWLVFTGLGSIVPLFFLSAHHPGTSVFDPGLIATGELLLIAIVLAVGSLGDLLYALCAGKLKKWLSLVALVFAGAALVAGRSIYLYMTATEPQDGKTWGYFNAVKVAHGSYWMFGAALAIGWGTLLLRRAEN